MAAWAPPAIAIGPPGSHPAPPAPAFASGAAVLDGAGVQVGRVPSTADTRAGDVKVVVAMDGKLIGVAASTLRFMVTLVESSQTKPKKLESAGATR